LAPLTSSAGLPLASHANVKNDAVDAAITAGFCENSPVSGFSAVTSVKLIIVSFFFWDDTFSILRVDVLLVVLRYGRENRVLFA